MKHRKICSLLFIALPALTVVTSCKEKSNETSTDYAEKKTHLDIGRELSLQMRKPIQELAKVESIDSAETYRRTIEDYVETVQALLNEAKSLRPPTESEKSEITALRKSASIENQKTLADLLDSTSNASNKKLIEDLLFEVGKKPEVMEVIRQLDEFYGQPD